MISLHVGEGLLVKFSSTELRTEIRMLVFGVKNLDLCHARESSLFIAPLPPCSPGATSV